MLSEKSIDNLIQPIIDAQEQFEFKVLQKLAFRIRQMSTLSYSAAMALVRSLFSGEDIINIQKDLAELSKVQIKRIDNVMRVVAKSIYEEAEVLYVYRKKPYLPLKKNKEICDLLLLLIDEIDDEYLGYINDPVFVIRQNSVATVKTAMPISTAYHSVLNEAAQTIQTGQDYNKTMARTLDQLLDSGLRKVQRTESGKSKSIKVSDLIRTAILEKTKQLNTAMQAIMAGQFGADGIEISAHLNSAPDHEPVQGRQFLKEEFDKLQSYQAFQDIKKHKYEPIRRPIGAWNCRHWTKSIVIGVSVPEYTEKQLKEIEKRNAIGYTAPNGKHYTMYECTQLQRTYERNIADYKQRYKIAKYADNSELQNKYFAKYSQFVNSYKAFSKACGLPINQDKF